MAEFRRVSIVWFELLKTVFFCFLELEVNECWDSLGMDLKLVSLFIEFIFVLF